MAGLTNYARNKLLAELQSGAMTSGVATFTLHQESEALQPTEGMLTDPNTGESWRIRLNQDTKRWEIVDDPA